MLGKNSKIGKMGNSVMNYKVLSSVFRKDVIKGLGGMMMVSANIDQTLIIFEHYLKYFTNNISLHSHRIPIDEKSKAYSYVGEMVLQDFH